MWALIMLGGGITTLVLGAIHVEDADETTMMFLSVSKGTAAVLLVVAWVYILTKVKQKMFAKQIRKV